jgi:hypothetical protein
MGLLLSLAMSLASGAQAKDEPPKPPVEVLKSAELFAMGKVGFAATISKEETALRGLLKEKDAGDRLAPLLAEASPAGKLYALLGLKRLKDKRYRDAAKTLLASEEPVKTMTGCIVSPATVKGVAAKIDRGAYK